MEIALLVPVKAFHTAKGRMATTLSPSQRNLLARWLATRVVTGSSVPVFVACDDEQVANWTTDLGAEVLWGPGLGLNGAIDQSIDVIGGKGFDQVIVCHGDLPLARDLERLAVADTVVLVPDRRLDGTNVLVRPTAIPLAAQYGAGSFRRHYRAALRAAATNGVAVEVRLDRDLSVDLDRVADCRHPRIAPLIAAALPELADTVAPSSNLPPNLPPNLQEPST